MRKIKKLVAVLLLASLSLYGGACLVSGGDDGGDDSAAMLMLLMMMNSGGTCTYTCTWDGDGVCDDGGVGSATSVCNYGTDCSDCGTRY